MLEYLTVACILINGEFSPRNTRVAREFGRSGQPERAAPSAAAPWAMSRRR